jgi:hypothetical protein
MATKTLQQRFDEKWIPEPNTGCWLWIGAIKNNGYGVIAGSDGRLLHAHRLAFALYVGPILQGMDIDHRCRTRACCNPEHLRQATRSQNMHNQSAHHDGSSKYKGVSYAVRLKKWNAQILIRGRNKHIGCFVTEEEAARAYDSAARTHFGPFANLNFQAD